MRSPAKSGVGEVPVGRVEALEQVGPDGLHDIDRVELGPQAGRQLPATSRTNASIRFDQRVTGLLGLTSSSMERVRLVVANEPNLRYRGGRRVLRGGSP